MLIFDTSACLRLFSMDGHFIGKLLNHTLNFIYNLLSAINQELVRQ